MARTLRFGIRNDVPDSTLSATPSPATDLENVRTEWSAQLALWTNLSSDPEIDGELNESSDADYFAMLHHSLYRADQMRLRLYSGTGQTGLVYDSGFLDLSETVASGAWSGEVDEPRALVHWLPSSTSYRSYRITPRLASYSGGPSLAIRMLLLGRALTLERGFRYGFPLSQLTAPKLVRTASGSSITSGRQDRARELNLVLPLAPDEDRNALERMESILIGRPFVFSAFADAEGRRFAKHSFLARFADRLVFVEQFDGSHEVGLPLVEV